MTFPKYLCCVRHRAESTMHLVQAAAVPGRGRETAIAVERDSLWRHVLHSRLCPVNELAGALYSGDGRVQNPESQDLVLREILKDLEPIEVGAGKPQREPLDVHESESIKQRAPASVLPREQPGRAASRTPTH